MESWQLQEIQHNKQKLDVKNWQIIGIKHTRRLTLLIHGGSLQKKNTPIGSSWMFVEVVRGDWWGEEQKVISLFFVLVNQLWEIAASRRLPVYGPRLCKWVETHIRHTGLMDQTDQCFSTLNMMENVYWRSGAGFLKSSFHYRPAMQIVFLNTSIVLWHL